jgi:hypothetical protein
MTPQESMSLVTQKVINELDYNDFDRIVQEVYGHPFEMVADEETGNYQAKTYSVEKEPLNKWKQESLDNFKQTGDYSYLTGILLQDLVNNDYLPEGDFVIEIFW